MATKTKREYFCDRCERQVAEKNDLDRYFIGHKTLYRNVGFDLCASCEEILARGLPQAVQVQMGLAPELT